MTKELFKNLCDRRSKMEKERDCLLDELQECTKEEYDLFIERIEKLEAMIIKEKEVTKSRKLSKDTILTSGAKVLCVLIVVGYEQAHALTSKALGEAFKKD